MIGSAAPNCVCKNISKSSIEFDSCLKSEGLGSAFTCSSLTAIAGSSTIFAGAGFFAGLLDLPCFADELDLLTANFGDSGFT